MVSLKKPTPKTEEVADVAAAKSANVQMNILVSPAFRKAVKQAALDEDTTVNELIERVVSEYMQNNDQ